VPGPVFLPADGNLCSFRTFTSELCRSLSDFLPRPRRRTKQFSIPVRSFFSLFFFSPAIVPFHVPSYNPLTFELNRRCPIGTTPSHPCHPPVRTLFSFRNGPETLFDFFFFFFFFFRSFCFFFCRTSCNLYSYSGNAVSFHCVPLEDPQLDSAGNTRTPPRADLPCHGANSNPAAHEAVALLPG